ncbi:MAG TPA: hypothetical protein VMZ04_03425, partial [Anaerolineae bacterium]|nr:hypothetical protein [Anaerolineae bacterium]
GRTDNAQSLARGIIKRAAAGATVIVLEGADQWIDSLNATVDGPAPFVNARPVRMSMGRYFMSTSPYFTGLPQAQSMGWEYQFFYKYGSIQGMNIDPRGADYIVAVATAGSPNIPAGLTGVKVGKGRMILTTMCFLDALASDLPQAAVPKKLFLNLMEQED